MKHAETHNSIHRVFTSLTRVSAVLESAYRIKLNTPHKLGLYKLILLMDFSPFHLFTVFPFSGLPQSYLNSHSTAALSISVFLDH